MGQEYHGHETKLRLYDDWLRDLRTHMPRDTVVAFVDGYDVLLSAAAKDLARRYTDPEHGFSHPIVFAAERSLWPDLGFRPLYPPPPHTTPTMSSSPDSEDPFPLEYLNSGTVVGRLWAVAEMLQVMRRDYGAVSS